MVLHNRVLAALALAMLAAAVGLPLLTYAPNRLVTGHGILLAALPARLGAAVWLPLALLLAAPLLPPSRRLHAAVLLLGSALMTTLAWLAGAAAARFAATSPELARTSFGGGFWLLFVLGWLTCAEALTRLPLGRAARVLAGIGALLPLALLLAGGQLDALSILQEYRNRQDVFDDALLRHVELVGCTLLPTMLLGVPLGVAAFRRRALNAPLFAVLNLIQTVPSIAMFALLMVPLAALAARLPWLPAHGVSGIGMAPAVLALLLYALLPVARATLAGLEQVPAPVVEAARGMGLTPSQIFWRVEVPLALPVLLSGLRVTTVQAIGLAVVAALIGAGGFGAIVFQGLLSSALDLVLLGVIPVIALALVADALFKLIVSVVETRR